MDGRKAQTEAKIKQAPKQARKRSTFQRSSILSTERKKARHGFKKGIKTKATL